MLVSIAREFDSRGTAWAIQTGLLRADRCTEQTAGAHSHGRKDFQALSLCQGEVGSSVPDRQKRYCQGFHLVAWEKVPRGPGAGGLAQSRHGRATILARRT